MPINDVTLFLTPFTLTGKEELGDVSLCEMVFRSNWLLVVKARRPCSLMLLDDQQRAFKAEVLFKTPIRALRARKDK